MTDTVLGLMTALGLSTAAGLNAYLPLLIVGALDRWTEVLTLDAPYDTLGEPEVMIAIGVVALVDFVGDKIPAIDSVLHAVGVVIAPVAGALVALAATGSDTVDPAFAIVLGRGGGGCHPWSALDRASGVDRVHRRHGKPSALAGGRRGLDHPVRRGSDRARRGRRGRPAGRRTAVVGRVAPVATTAEWSHPSAHPSGTMRRAEEIL